MARAISQIISWPGEKSSEMSLRFDAIPLLWILNNYKSSYVNGSWIEVLNEFEDRIQQQCQTSFGKNYFIYYYVGWIYPNQALSERQNFFSKIFITKWWSQFPIFDDPKIIFGLRKFLIFRQELLFSKSMDDLCVHYFAWDQFKNWCKREIFFK